MRAGDWGLEASLGMPSQTVGPSGGPCCVGAEGTCCQGEWGSCVEQGCGGLVGGSANGRPCVGSGRGGRGDRPRAGIVVRRHKKGKLCLGGHVEAFGGVCGQCLGMGPRVVPQSSPPSARTKLNHRETQLGEVGWWIYGSYLLGHLVRESKI